MSALEVQGLSVRYGRFAAVNGIDLRVDPGEVVVVLGANGAGKSSTMNAISGAVPLADGRVVFDGREISSWPSYRVARHGLVQVPEGRHVIGPMTVEENLLLGAYALRRRSRQSVLLEEAYELFPVLGERRHAVAGLLSGGQQQMLAFGRALMSEPRMLLLDEPSMGLAPIVIDTVMDAVRSIAERGLSILMVEQNATAAFDVSTRAYVLEQGEIVLEGPSDEVSEDPRVLRAFLGLDESPDGDTSPEAHPSAVDEHG